MRLKNVAREGTLAPYGPTYGPIGIEHTLKAVKDHPHMRKAEEKSGRGSPADFGSISVARPVPI